ncbi:hypothetical protein [Lacisediminihabitans sp.]|uniref:hypothetical protein n=1 Tax=Lacisediminihabitans sp. TaxID=2787631 RepID=UPI00374CC412
MNNTTKKTAFGIAGVAAAALLTIGMATPAMASSNDSHTANGTATQTRLLGDVTGALGGTDVDGNGIGLSNFLRGANLGGSASNSSPVVLAPQVGVGDVASGGVLNGSAVASDNDVAAPIASGNTTPVASGNDVPVANGSGNTTVSPDVTGNDVTGNSATSSVSDLADVDSILRGVGSSVDLNSILGR